MDRSEGEVPGSQISEAKQEHLNSDMEAAEAEAAREEGEEQGAGDGEGAVKRRRRKYAIWVAYVGAGYHVSFPGASEPH
jgi:ribosomal protein L19E